MAKDDIQFTLPSRTVKKSDAEFVVRTDGVKLGTLKVSTGTDIVIFYEVQHPRDYVRLMDILIGHFQGRLDHDQMETLHEVGSTVIFDLKGEIAYPGDNPQYFFYIPPKKDEGDEPVKE